MAESRMAIGFRTFRRVLGSGIFSGWHVQRSDCGGCGTRTRFPVVVRSPRGAGGSGVRDRSCGDLRIYLEVEVRRVECRQCGTVKTERLEFLADNPCYTKRFAYYVGRRCRQATIKDIAEG